MEKITINLNGQSTEVLDLATPNQREKAIVDLATLRRITSYLQSASFRQIKEQFVAKISTTGDLEEMVNMAADEVAFHQTVNLIQSLNTPAEQAEA